MAYKWAVLLCLMPGLTVFLLDATIVNVALAKLGAVFGVDVATVQWAITAFALASGVATPMASFFEARFTMKRMWVTALTTFTAASVLYGLSRVSADGWGAPTVQGLIGLGLVTLLVFVVYEAARAHPLLDLRLFANGQFLVANVVGWVSTIALFGAEFMLPLYLQNLRGLTAVETGLLLLPQGLAVAVAGPIAGRMVDRVGARAVVLVGFGLLAFNTWQLSFITIDTPYSTLRWLLIVRGLALGCTMQPTQLVALGVVPERLRTNATSLNAAMRNVFQSFGIAVLSTVVQTQQAMHTAQLGWQMRADTLQGAALAQLSDTLQVQAGVAPSAADLAALSLVVRQIAQQAAVLAFGDAYRITFVAALVSVAAALMLPGRGQIKADPTAMGAH